MEIKNKFSDEILNEASKVSWNDTIIAARELDPMPPFCASLGEVSGDLLCLATAVILIRKDAESLLSSVSPTFKEVIAEIANEVMAEINAAQNFLTYSVQEELNLWAVKNPKIASNWHVYDADKARISDQEINDVLDNSLLFSHMHRDRAA